MYPVRGDEDPLVTLIPASQVILPPHHHQPWVPLPPLRLRVSAPWRPPNRTSCLRSQELFSMMCFWLNALLWTAWSSSPSSLLSTQRKVHMP
ncbi:hypothetical protein DSO57_1034111 [Entomophthora muscae]|uniref:Uncharacterized protein n=1 Tax=Entomophthora muscae TaxID=34485 RepID=A0ACC2UJU0_9FUNG|nr:hypothetical protein DSO57_1034111 [Entomophthora muscae]